MPLLDGLRGVGAVAVSMLHLFYEPLGLVAPRAQPVFHYLSLGVYVFFVVSGFAIAQSLAASYITVPLAGRFLLRRVCRLDPPYWASMALALLVAYVANRLLHQGDLPPSVSVRTLVVHILYLQYVLQVPSISDVYWTLAFEIQFYLLFVFFLTCKQRLQAFVDEPVAFAVVFAPPLLFSLMVGRGYAPTFPGFCAGAWFAFFAGVVTQRLVTRGDWRSYLITLLMIAVVAAEPSLSLTVLGTAGLIGLAWRRHRLDRWLAGPVWQYLGRISYTLYLVHWVVGGRGANLVRRFLHTGPIGGLLCSFIGVVFALVAAHGMWWAVERPSLRLSRMIRTR